MALRQLASSHPAADATCAEASGSTHKDAVHGRDGLHATGGAAGGGRREGGEEASFDVSGFVYARWDAIGDQVQQECFFAGWRIFNQFQQPCNLLGTQGFWGDILTGAFGDVVAVSFKHGRAPLVG